MDLDTYLREKGYGEPARIAREAGIHYTTLTAIRKRKSIPSALHALRISQATGGAVSIAELCEPAGDLGAA